MKHTALVAALLLSASPAYAQFGGLDRLKKGAETAKKVADLNISEKDERAIGEVVSSKLIDRFGQFLVFGPYGQIFKRNESFEIGRFVLAGVRRKQSRFRRRRIEITETFHRARTQRLAQQ